MAGADPGRLRRRGSRRAAPRDIDGARFLRIVEAGAAKLSVTGKPCETPSGGHVMIGG
ncbi:hypothetical protein [Actinoplanes xinjiangensis]|uniref:hypothetical protein n=1 Tax=Actinoplanes xinjiangensis TaxID=512350 RepID=UPI003442D4C1